MRQNLAVPTQKCANDAVVAGKHGAPLISDAALAGIHQTLLSARSARIKFPAVYAALLAEFSQHDRVTTDGPLSFASLAVGTPLEASADLATGLALGLAEHQPGSLVFAFLRQDRLVPDRFRRTLHLAAQHQLPILYILLPAPRSTFDWSARAILENVPCIPVDAHDAVALYRVAQETIQRARAQGGPSLIDARQVKLVRGDSNPVARLEAHLRRKGLSPAAQRKLSSPPLPSSSRLAHVLANYDQTGCR